MSDVWPSMFGAEFGEFGALQAGRQRLFSRIYCNYFRFLERGGARGERVSVHDAAFDYRDATPYDHAHDTPTTVASDWLANELAEHGEIDAAYRDRIVMHLMTAAGASAPADAVFRFTAGDAMQTEDDDEDADRSEDYSDDGRASDL